MGDPPFDLSKFDPSTLDLSHLHPAEQNRIRNRQFSAQELSLLLSKQNPWPESGKPKPLPLPPAPEPEPPKTLESGPTSSRRKGLADFAKDMEQSAKGPDLSPLIKSLKEHDEKTKRAIRSLVWGDESDTGQSRQSHLTPEDLARIDAFEGSEGSMVQGSAAPPDPDDGTPKDNDDKPKPWMGPDPKASSAIGGRTIAASRDGSTFSNPLRRSPSEQVIDDVRELFSGASPDEPKSVPNGIRWYKHRELVVGIVLACGAGIMTITLLLLPVDNKARSVLLGFMLLLLAFSVSLVLHYFFDRLRASITAGVLLSVLLTGAFGWYVWPATPPPDWRRSDEAKELASQMASDVQKLQDEGRLIDLTDYHRAIKVRADWVEKCSVTLGRIDNQMRKFRRETTYRYYFEKLDGEVRKLLSDKNEDRKIKILGDVIHVDVLALQAVETALAGDTSPDRDPNYPNLLNPLF